MPEAIAVEIVLVVSGLEPPATQIEYRVTNQSDATFWLVDDPWLIWSRTGKRIELSYKRGELRKGSQVFGYFDPAVVEIGPGQVISRRIELSWPQPLDELWNDEASALPPPGEYEVSVRVGYGTTPRPEAPDLGESVEAPVLRWQREAVSQPVRMEIPPYPAQ